MLLVGNEGLIKGVSPDREAGPVVQPLNDLSASPCGQLLKKSLFYRVQSLLVRQDNQFAQIGDGRARRDNPASWGKELEKPQLALIPLTRRLSEPLQCFPQCGRVERRANLLLLGAEGIDSSPHPRSVQHPSDPLLL